MNEAVAWHRAGATRASIPLIDFRVPADGEYTVRLYDLTYTGSPEHVYRLDVDTGPRLEFAWPNVVEQGKTTRVTLFGRNLPRAGGWDADPSRLDRVEFDVTPPGSGASVLARTFARPARFAVDEFPADLPNSPSPVLVGITDVPVVLDSGNNHEAATAQEIDLAVRGQRAAGGRRRAGLVSGSRQRGDVIWLELFGERIGAPVDLDLSVLDAGGKRELLHLADSLEDPKEGAIPISHSDPSGRWVAPATGDYRIVVRNVIGGANRDPQPDLPAERPARRGRFPAPGGPRGRSGSRRMERAPGRSGVDRPRRDPPSWPVPAHPRDGLGPARRVRKPGRLARPGRRPHAADRLVEPRREP